MRKRPLFIIVSLTERDSETGEPLYWNNDIGWGSKSSATTYSGSWWKGREPPFTGKWVELVEDFMPNPNSREGHQLYSKIGTKQQRLDQSQVGGDHYKKRAFTPWQIIDEYGLDFYAGNALKYLLRAKDKNGLEDLKKCRHYLDKLIQLLESKNAKPHE